MKTNVELYTYMVFLEDKQTTLVKNVYSAFIEDGTLFSKTMKAS